MDYTELLPPLPEQYEASDFSPKAKVVQISELRAYALAAIAAAAPAIRKAEMERICSLLNGIDKTELQDRDGWWETNAGADFGARILNDIRALPEEPAEQGEKP